MPWPRSAFDHAIYVRLVVPNYAWSNEPRLALAGHQVRECWISEQTKLVSHGSDRFQTIPSKIQRTDRNRVSSIPSLLVRTGSGSHFVAATTSALCAVGQDTRYSTATSETARLPDAIAIATRCRSRSVTRARGRTLPRPE